MRADRLLSLLLLLQNRGKMSSRELAEKLEVSERTIFRDMEALSAAGIPVYAERGSGGGWSLTEGYRTRLTGMKAEEIATLLIANSSALLTDLGMSGEYDSAFQKLLAASPESLRQETERVRQRIHIDGAGWHRSVEQLPHLPLVQEAVWEERKLRIRYRRDDRIAERIICPLGLVAKGSIWYAAAETEGEMRTYRISRLLDAELLEERFTRPPSFDLAEYWEESLKDFQARLPRYPAQIRIRETVFHRFSRERFAKVRQPYEEDNGWVKADVEFNTLESALGILLSYGSGVYAVTPEELRSGLIAETKKIRRLYDKDE
ncbi:YafY family protein [Paenibacillus sp. UNC499MF]|uniref:helix-turn-helix transcriptional regulator n=1 Tax=Paenibacillus sp. UNC499MF TaxID=1502751 RepID=UPI00089F85F9|nr:WYL domain-containing protein [Paenibacillus sp. UNC499MF]SEG08683.1 Predicted DNA-binding transcriptional regulator YafY, contains an HTH and WYL domains [Paenibacillus sp. UNC499MF]